MTATPAIATPRYEVYGVSLETEFDFANSLAVADRKPALAFKVIDFPLVPRETWGEAVRGEPGHWSLHRTADTEILHFDGEADFFLSPGQIDCFVPDSSLEYIVEIRLLGAVLAYWLELQGILALHASAVVHEQQAVAFVSGNGGGKTSLAAELLRRGRQLLTDDLLAVDLSDDRWCGLPGYPQMRMWPRDAARFVDDPSQLPIVHPEFDKLRMPVGPEGIGSFCQEATELRAIYFLNASDAASHPTFQAVPPGEAVFRLAQAAFAAPVVGALPDQEQRLHALADLASRVPVRTLTLPTGASRSAEAADAVIADMEQLR